MTEKKVEEVAVVLMVVIVADTEVLACRNMHSKRQSLRASIRRNRRQRRS